MNSLPIEQLINLKRQGLNNQAIFQMLMKQGFTPEQISEALRRIELNEQVGKMAVPRGGMMPPNTPPQMPPNMGGMGQQQQRPSYSTAQISQIAEAIIEEKWKALLDNVNKVIAWKESSEAKMRKIEQDLAIVKQDFDRIHQTLNNRMHESESAVKDVGVDLKALTKVFEKILPGFIDNMHSLDRITKELGDLRNGITGDSSSTGTSSSSARKTTKKTTKRATKSASSSSSKKNDDIFAPRDEDSLDDMF